MLVRTDLPSNNGGKMMAQACHAQAEFDDWVINNKAHQTIPFIDEWKENRSFGTTITLECDISEIEYTLKLVADGYPAGKTTDPTYPWKNFYNEIFFNEVVTCAWIFVYDETPQEVKQHISNLPLHR